MGLTPAIQRDGNGNIPNFVGVTPGVGYALPQMGPQTTDATTGQPIAPTAVSLAAANLGLPANLPSIVQKAVGVSTGSVASLAQAFVNNNAGGNSIVVVCACGNGTAMTVADSLGNTYTQAINAPNSTTFEVAIFFASNILPGPNTVTATNAGTAASMGMEIYEVSGLLALAQAQPGQTSSGTGSGASVTTSAIAPSVPNALVFAGVAIGTGVVTAFAAGSGSGLTYDSGIQQPATPSGLYQFASLSGFLGNIGGVTPNVTWTTSRASAMAAAIFKPVALGIEGTVRIGGYNVTNITAAAPTTTVVKTGPGVLHALDFTAVATGVIKLYDGVTAVNLLRTITSPATLLQNEVSKILDIAFANGLTIVTSTAAQDIAVMWK